MFDSFSLELTHPWWLAPLGFVVPLLVYYFWRSLSDFPRKQLVVSLLTRCVVVGLLTLSLAGLTLLNPTLQKFVIIAIDQSLSVDSGDAIELPTTDKTKEPVKKSQVDEYLDAALTDAARVGEHKVMFLPFASQAGALMKERPKTAENSRQEKTPTGPLPGVPGRGDKAAIDRNATDIAAAIRSAAGAMPPDYVPRIVLLTDGNQTAGDALQAALGTASATTFNSSRLIGLGSVNLRRHRRN